MARKALINFRRDTAANWTSANPTLASGEPGFETNTGKVKIGDGSTAWNTLGYVNPGGGVGTLASPGGTITVTNPTGPTANIDLPASGVTAASYGDSTHAPQIAVDAQGRITSASSILISGAGGGGAGLSSVVSTINPILFTSTSTFSSAPLLLGCRVVVPLTGHLRDIAVYVSGSSGNIEVGIYDTAATTRNRLYTSGSIATPAAGAWRIIGDPNLAVTAGDTFDLVVSIKNTSVSLLRFVPLNTTMTTLPSGYIPGSGGTPWLSWAATGVSSVTATLAESAMAANSNSIAVIARVS